MNTIESKHIEDEGVTVEYDRRVTEVGQRVVVTEDYSTRIVGQDTEYQAREGQMGEVLGYWDECFDVHVRFGLHEVWIAPDSLAVAGGERLA